MAFSVGGWSSQGTDAWNNYSSVSAGGTVYTDAYTSFWGQSSTGYVNIGGAEYAIGGPGTLNKSSSWSWSASRGYGHDVNGYRGDVGTSVRFIAHGYPWDSGWRGTGTQGAIDFDRSPNAPATPTLSSRNRGTVSLSTSSGGRKNQGPEEDYLHWYIGGPGETTAPTYWTQTGWSASRSDLTPTSTYYFKAYAHNSDGWSSPSGVITVYGVPVTPSTPSVVRSTTTSGQINISWTAPSSNLPITQYSINRDGEFWTSTTSTSISDNQTRGTTHSYTITAQNASGLSDASSSASAMAPGVPSIPGVPTVANKVGRTLTINSTKGAMDYGNTISEYRIQLSTDNGVTWKGWNNTTQSFTATDTYNVLDSSGNFTYSLLTPALTYKWRVYAMNSVGTGDYATTAVGTFVSAGGRRWNGSAWVPTENVKRWDGSQWVDTTVAKRWNGSAWDNLV